MTQQIEAGMHEQPVEPRIEAIRVAQPGQAPPGANETLLDRVARELRVPEDQPVRRVQPRDQPADEHVEGVMIASHRPVHELSLVHGGPPGCCAAIRSRSDGMAAIFWQEVPGGRNRGQTALAATRSSGAGVAGSAAWASAAGSSARQSASAVKPSYPRAIANSSASDQAAP